MSSTTTVRLFLNCFPPGTQVYCYIVLTRCDDFSNRILSDWRHSSDLASHIARTAEKKATHPQRITTPSHRELLLPEPTSYLSPKRRRAPPSLASTEDPPDEPESESAVIDASESYRKFSGLQAPRAVEQGGLLLDERALWREATRVLKAERRERRSRKAEGRIAKENAGLWANVRC